MIAKNATTISGTIGMQSADDVAASTNPSRLSASRRAIHLSRQLAVGEDTARALFGSPSECRGVFARRADPFVEAVVDDVHFAADAPSRPRQTGRGVDDSVVGRGELDAEIGEHRVPEPLRIVDRAPMQLRKILNAVRRHEATELAGGHDICRGSPGKFTMRVQHSHLMPSPLDVDTFLERFDEAAQDGRHVALLQPDLDRP